MRLVDGEDVTGCAWGFASVMREGEELSFQLFQMEETVDPTTGYRRLKDLDGDGLVNGNDFGIIASPLPDHFGGFTNDFKWKNFDLSVFFQWTYGNSILNSTRGSIQTTGRGSTINRTGPNLSAEALGRWVNEGDITSFPRIDYNRPSFNDDSPFNLSRPTDQNLEDGSFLRLKNISLGYTFPSELLSKLNLRTARVYITGSNIFTLTRYSGYDPEVSHDINTNIAIGYDNGTFPQPKVVIMGVNVGI